MDGPLGIICPLAEEAAALAAHLDGAGRLDDRPGRRSVRRGRIDANDVVLIECGIGKVGAAAAATLLADRYRCRALLLVGVAGGLDPKLVIGDLLVARRLIQHDYGALVGQRLRNYRAGTVPLGEARAPLAFDLAPELLIRLRQALAGLDLPELPAAATGGRERVPAIHFGTLLTGDQFVNCAATRRRLHAAFDAQAVDMEGCAVAQVAEGFDLPAVVLRAVSDLAGAESHIAFPSFLEATAAVAALLVRRILPLL